MQTFDVIRDSVARVLWAVSQDARKSMSSFDFSVVVLNTMHQVRYSALPVAVAVQVVELGVAEGRIPHHFLTDIVAVTASSSDS